MVEDTKCVVKKTIKIKVLQDFFVFLWMFSPYKKVFGSFRFFKVWQQRILFFTCLKPLPSTSQASKFGPGAQTLPNDIRQDFGMSVGQFGGLLLQLAPCCTGREHNQRFDVTSSKLFFDATPQTIQDHFDWTSNQSKMMSFSPLWGQ